MAKVKNVIVYNSEDQCVLRRLVKAGLVSFAAIKGNVIVGRYNTNKGTLLKILRKELSK